MFSILMRHLSEMQFVHSQAKALKSKLERSGIRMLCRHFLGLRIDSKHIGGLKEKFTDSAEAFDVSNSPSCNLLRSSDSAMCREYAQSSRCTWQINCSKSRSCITLSSENSESMHL